MMENNTTFAREARNLSIQVCVFSTIGSALCGGLAAIPYGDIEGPRTYHIVGMCLGGVLGLLAGIVWCKVMYRQSCTRKNKNIFSFGAWLGVAVGAGATIPLHLILSIIGYGKIIVGCEAIAGLFLFGMPLGALLGGVYGTFWEKMTEKVFPRED